MMLFFTETQIMFPQYLLDCEDFIHMQHFAIILITNRIIDVILTNINLFRMIKTIKNQRNS